MLKVRIGMAAVAVAAVATGLMVAAPAGALTTIVPPCPVHPIVGTGTGGIYISPPGCPITRIYLLPITD